MTAFHVAQLNIGRARGAVDGPVMAEFMALLDPVNAVADASPGFVWRLQTDDGNATALRPYEDDRMIVNMSVWESIDGARSLRLSQRARRRHAPPARVVRVDEALHGAVVDPGGRDPDGRRGQGAPRAPARQRADALRLHLQGALPVARRGRRRSSSTTTCAARPRAAGPTAARGCPSRAQPVVDRDGHEARVAEHGVHGCRRGARAAPRGRRRARAPTPPRA